MNDQTILKIRDGIDIYLIGEDLLTVYFMNTRKKIQFKANQFSVKLLETINGKKTISEIRNHLEQIYAKTIQSEGFHQLLKKLIEKGILVIHDNDIYSSYLSEYELERFDRQLNFISDFLPGTEAKYQVQKKLCETRILIFGCGAIGGWIATQLAMVGVKHFILFDGDQVEETDIARHVYYTSEYVGLDKVEALSRHLNRISSRIEVRKIAQFLTPQSDISTLIADADFVINTADEPYIGYTSIKVSRECIKQNKAHFIGGGFDAHLASTGELIIPGVTACVDCYSDHFKEVLKDWKPESHPVEERFLEIGGLPSMALWSASFAAIEIIKYLGTLVPTEQSDRPRGEFLFDTMRIDYLNVKRNPYCKTCGGLKYET